MSTLWAALEGLPDRRTRKGRRYSLASIVGISLAAMLSGANDLRAIFRWGRRLTPKGLEAFGITRRRAPCHATYHYVFRSIAAEDLERALGAVELVLGLAEPAAGLGGVAPVGHLAPIETLVDVALADHDQVWAAAGHARTVFPTTFDELVRITGGTPADVA
jgi:hypothetical protein